MSKLKVKIKQHTPLIHFQSKQAGAILRATEVKPKLDRFLLEYIFKDFEEYKHHLIGYDKEKTEDEFKDIKAFNYKLRITSSSKDIENEDIEFGTKNSFFPNYFGNMGKSEKNRFVYCSILNMEFFSFDKYLLEKIAINLPLFLMKNNFGQRQSKGFGSFFLDNENRYYIDGHEKYYDERYFEKLKYSFVVDLNKIYFNKDLKGKSDLYKQAFYVFKKIEKTYINIRKGVGKSQPYIKNYVQSENIIWEKDCIKERYCGFKIKNNSKKYIIKDLLGFSQTEKWTDDRIITKENDNIERYQSPIFFKPLKIDEEKYIVYFEGREISEEYLDKEFVIKCNGKGDLKLKTPEIFDIDKFLEYVKSQNKYIKINK